MAKAQDCDVRLTKESSGYHLYLPCPACLDTHGKGELNDPKYAINLSKYFGIGDDYRHLSEDRETAGGFNPNRHQFNRSAGDIRDSRSGVCMRTSKASVKHLFSVSELLAMTTVTERHPDIKTKARVRSSTDDQEREAHWEADPQTGILCPPPPGLLTPLPELPADHPAIWYVRTRGFDPERLWKQFRASWCHTEYKEGTNGIWYKKMPGGWKDTPQGRIIFHSLFKGTPMTWQGRYLDSVTPDGLNRHALNPYSGQWDHVATRAALGQAWFPVPPFDQTDDTGVLKWQPSKYKTAKYSSRELMGWDAAMELPDAVRWCVLCEGPLDAARVGPGGIALIGKSISPENAAKVASNFHLVFTAFDNDRAGREATDKITSILMGVKVRAPMVQHVVPIPIPEGKDIATKGRCGCRRMKIPGWGRDIRRSPR